MNKVISREVIGSSNPFAKFFRELAASVKGIATGIIMIIVAFVLVWFFANQTEHSKIMAELPLQTPSEVEGSSGMVKIHAVPEFSNTVVARETDKDVLYYTYTLEDYAVREVEKTRTITEDGQEIRETYVVYEKDWKVVETETKWSDFDLGGIMVEPGKAKLQVDEQTFYTATEDLDFSSWKDDEDLVDVAQKQRETVVGVPVDDELIVAGVLAGGKISTGGETETFFISNKSHEVLLADQESAEKTMFWIMVFISWFLMTTGFTMLLGPITKILGVIPGVGGLVSSLLFIIFGVVSAVIIFFAYIGMKYWWLILLLVLVAVGVWLYLKLKKNPEIKHLPKKK